MELPVLKFKADLAYREAVRIIGPGNVWDGNNLPAYFKTQRKSLNKDTNSLVAFFYDSGEFGIGLGRKMPLAVFADAYQHFVKSRNLRGAKITSKKVCEIGRGTGVRVEVLHNEYYDGEMRNEEFVIGFGPVADS